VGWVADWKGQRSKCSCPVWRHCAVSWHFAVGTGRTMNTLLTKVGMQYHVIVMFLWHWRHLVVSGGIDDIVAQLKQESAAQGLPCLFALSRRQLGYLTFKKVGVSCIGICSYEGSEVCIATYEHCQVVTVFNWCRWCQMWMYAAVHMSFDWFGRCQIGWTSEVWFLGSAQSF
jgi:hypothetical protein